MSEFLDKLTSYNLFNYLVPGVVFCALADRLTAHSMLLDDVVVGLFFYYFVGMVISRIGSVVVEPLMQKIGALEYPPYSDFVAAVKADPKIDTLSEVNNTYRTFCSLFLCLAAFTAAAYAPQSWGWMTKAIPILVVLSLLALFAFSYAKQTRYVVTRIKETIP